MITFDPRITYVEGGGQTMITFDPRITYVEGGGQKMITFDPRITYGEGRWWRRWRRGGWVGGKSRTAV